MVENNINLNGTSMPPPHRLADGYPLSWSATHHRSPSRRRLQIALYRAHLTTDLLICISV